MFLVRPGQQGSRDLGGHVRGEHGEVHVIERAPAEFEIQLAVQVGGYLGRCGTAAVEDEKAAAGIGGFAIRRLNTTEVARQLDDSRRLPGIDYQQQVAGSAIETVGAGIQRQVSRQETGIQVEALEYA